MPPKTLWLTRERLDSSEILTSNDCFVFGDFKLLKYQINTRFRLAVVQSNKESATSAVDAVAAMQPL